ncbi:MAG TPA: dodecin [Vicinamibacterales bacterium]
MPDHVYKTVELVGSSTKGFDDAVNTAIGRAATTLRNLRWFQVVETRGLIEEGRIAYWQVALKVGFTLED